MAKKIIAIPGINPLTPNYLHRFFEVVEAMQSVGFSVSILDVFPFDQPSIDSLRKLGFEVIFLFPSGHPDTAKTIPFLSRFGGIFGRSVARSRQPSIREINVNDEIRKRFTQAIDRENPSFLFINYIEILRVSDFCSIPIIYDAQEIKSIMDFRLSQIENSLNKIQKLQDLDSVFDNEFSPEFLLSQTREFIEDYEIDLLKRSEIILTPSNKEKEILERFLYNNHIYHLPITVGRPIKKDIFGNFSLFSMGPNYFNLLGYYYFLKNIAPLVGVNLVKTPLLVTSLLDGKPSIAADGIGIRGRVPGSELEELYKTSGFFANPVYFGIGMQVKIIQAMSKGLPVLAMESPLQDMPVDNNVNGLIAKDAEAFAEFYKILATDKGLLRKFSKASIEAIKERYSHERRLYVMSGIFG